MITNDQLADALNNIADFLEEQEDNPYRVRAYRQGARALRRYPHQAAELIIQNIDLTTVPHIGDRLAQVITTMINTNSLEWTPKTSLPLPLPKNMKKNRRKLPSFKIYSVMATVEKLLQRLQALPEISRAEFADEYRRKKEVITNIQILAISTCPQTVFEKFHLFPALRYIINTNENSTTVQLKLGIYVTLTIVDVNFFGTLLLTKTGAEQHYVHLNEIAIKQGIRLETFLAPEEKNIYQALQLSYIPPELRENRGEIEAAKNNSLPTLINLADIKGDLHCHTSETDGYFTLEEMVAAAQEEGYEYVAITDHSKSLKITNGMDEKRLLQQIKKIDQLNTTFSNFRILKSMEIDILLDGSLDLSDDVLKELDITVCSIHSKFRIPMEQQTERIIRAMDNKYFNILGHATGRLINSRPPYQIDIERILLAAKERNCFIEVNAQPARLDINDIYCKQAKDLGVKVAISSDAHTLKGFSFMILGVNQARRGWLEAKDVINTRPLNALRKLIKRY